MRKPKSTSKSPSPAVRGHLDPLEPRLLLAYASLVQDINRTTDMLAPEQFKTIGSVAYFGGRAVDGAGAELWRTDGTSAGTVQVKDIYPGLTGSDLGNLTDVGGTLYFTARDPDAGLELWKSDGTAAGTVRVKDVRPGNADSAPANLTAVGNTLYFTANDGTSGVELWKSDGTAAGTVRVKDIYAGSTASNPQYLVAHNGALLFAAADGPTGRELWRSDGTDAGTTRVADIVAGSSGSGPRHLVPFAGAVYFAADPSGSASYGDLYRTDGTAGGTTRVADVAYNPGGFTDYGTIMKIVPSGDRLYFLAGNANNGKYDLWRSDGTTPGTSVLLGGSPFYSYSPLTAAGQRSVVFTHGTAATGAEPWVSDGTVAGTAMLKDVLPGTPSGLGEVTYARVGNTVYFAPNRVSDGLTELWKTDLTPAGTVKVTNVAAAAGYISWTGALGSKLLFNGLRYVGTGDLYASDGTAGGTVRIGATAAGNSSGMQEYPTFSPAFGRSGETMYFAASDGVSGREVWRTRGGGLPGAELTSDIAPNGFPSDPDYYFTGPNGWVYFRANSPATGTELYRVPLGGAPQLVADINPGAASSNAQVVGTLGGWVYVRASDATTASALWRYNPSTGALTKMTGPTGESITFPGTMAVMGGHAYFAGDTASTGVELWRTDGSSTTAQLVKDVTGSYTDSYPSLLTVAGNTLYFFAEDPVAGDELWKSDGTTAGTVRVADVTPGWNSTTYNAMYALDGIVYFDSPAGATSQRRLWRSDGTPAGTYELAPLQGPAQFTSLGGQLYFAADDAQGRAVFRYDPSNPSAAPVRLTPTTTGSFPLRPTALHAAGTHVYFVALAGAGRGDHYELWQTDGTAGGGTKKIRDVQPVVPAGTTPSLGGYFTSGFYALGSNSTHLFFPAWTPELGMELYRLPLADPAGAIRGAVFDDRDRDGVRDAGEPGLAGRTVFVDSDGDGALDADEPAATTDGAGNYAVTGLEARSYTLRQTFPAGWFPTGATWSQTVTVGAGPLDGVNFSQADIAAPAVVSGAPAADRPSQVLRVTFSEDVGASLAAADLRLTNLGTSADVDPAKVAVSFDPATLTATFGFPGYPGGALPDGNYRATILAAGVADASANRLAADFAFDFFVLTGDVDRNRVVNFDDLLILAGNYNKAGKTWADGDLDGNGLVNFDDLLILAGKYNKALPAPVVATEPATAPATTASVLRDDGDKAKPVFSTTRVAKPAPVKPAPPAKPKAVAKPKGR